jgi:hypothetical protein
VAETAYNVGVTSEERLDRVAVIVAESGERIKALNDAQMMTTMTLNRVLESQASLQETQKRTAETLQAFIRSMHEGGNGHQ